MINATSAAGDEKDSFSSSVSGIPAKIKIISDPLLCKVLVLTILKYLFTHTIWYIKFSKLFIRHYSRKEGFLGGANDKESACQCRFIPGLRRSSIEGNDNLLQYFCLENSMHRGIWWTTVTGPQRVGHDWAQSMNRSHLCILQRRSGDG